MIGIPLTRGLEAIIDEGDDETVRAFKWYAAPVNGIWYAQRHVRKPREKTIKLHTFLTGLPFVDHVNGDGLDNRRSNLRVATQSQNCMNARARSGGSSTYKGVYWDTRRRRWCAQIRTKGIRKYLGYFNEEITAALTYDDAARELFHEFGVFNFPHVGERSALTGEIQ